MKNKKHEQIITRILEKEGLLDEVEYFRELVKKAQEIYKIHGFIFNSGVIWEPTLKGSITTRPPGQGPDKFDSPFNDPEYRWMPNVCERTFDHIDRGHLHSKNKNLFP